MRKAWILLFLGIWMVALPYLGFPYSWKDLLTNLTGLLLICFSFLIYKDYKKGEGQETIFDNYKENNDFVVKNEIQDNDEIGTGNKNNAQ